MSFYRTLLRHSAVYSIAIVLSKMASFILLPVYTRHLTPGDYGVLELLELTAFVLASLVGTRVADALMYFYSAETGDRDRVLLTAFLGAHLCGIAGATAGWALADPITDLVFNIDEDRYHYYFRLLFVNFAFSFPQEVGFAYLRVLNRSGTFVTLQLARLIFVVAVNLVLLIGFHMGVAAMLWSNLIGSVVLSGLMAVYVLRNFPFTFDARMFGRILRYATPLGLSALGMTVIHQGDRYFLQRATSLADIGIYAIAYKIGMLVGYVQLPFVTYWNSQMFSLARDKEGGVTAYVRTCTYYTLALAAAAVMLSVFSVPAIRILATPAFYDAAVFVPAIAVAYVIRGLGDYFRSAFAIYNQPSRNLTVTFSGLLTALAAYSVLIPFFQLWGAVVATAATFIIMSAVCYRQAQKVKAYPFEWGRLIRIAVAALTAIMTSLLIQPSSLVWQLVLGAACMGIFGVLLILLKFFSAEEVRILKSEIQSVRGRLLPVRPASPADQ